MRQSGYDWKTHGQTAQTAEREFDCRLSGWNTRCSASVACADTGRQNVVHNPSSLQKMWDIIGEATCTLWKVEVALDKAAEMIETYRRGWKDAKRLSFSIERIG